MLNSLGFLRSIALIADMSLRKLNKSWTPKDERTLVRLKSEGKSFMQIGRLIGRTAAACDGRWQKIKREASARTPLRRTESKAVREDRQ